jgi:peptidoglycan/LPS O-acetylase OafA/YrhL
MGSEVRQAGERRNARLESLRGVGAIAVLTAHVYGIAHGYNPAALLNHGIGGFLFSFALFMFFMFFALSGYLLYRPFALRAFGGGGPINVARYAHNRAVRVLPLYFSAVVIMLLFTQSGGTWGQWWRFGTLTENYFTATAGTVDGPLWSLAVELTFYIVLPILAWLVARLARGSMRRAVAVLLALGAASVWVRVHFYLSVFVGQDSRWDWNLASFLFAFVVGMLLALLRIHWDRGAPRWSRGVLGHSLTWLAGSVALWLIVTRNLRWDPILAPAAFLLVGACALPLRQSRLLRGLDWRWVVGIGIASYSLYVWHFPVVARIWESTHVSAIVLEAITLPLCVAIALGSYRLIEAPFLRRRRRWSSVTAGAQTDEPGPEPASEPTPMVEPARAR